MYKKQLTFISKARVAPMRPWILSHVCSTYVYEKTGDLVYFHEVTYKLSETRGKDYSACWSETGPVGKRANFFPYYANGGLAEVLKRLRDKHYPVH
jgi:hypothetical protein